MTKPLVYFTAVSANLCVLACGLFFGWTSPVLPLYQEKDYGFKLSPSEESLVTALLPIGGVFGCLLAVYSANRAGRKYTMLATVIPITTSWLLIFFATSSWDLKLSRFVAGLATGACYVAVPMYLGEISPANIRGIVLTGIQVAEKTGILIEYSYGPFLSVHLGALIALVFPLLFGLTFMWLPESPVYLVHRNLPKDARKALLRFHEDKNVTQELESIEQSIDRENSGRSGFGDVLLVAGNRRALSITLMLIIVQQFTGTQAVISYAQDIFGESRTPVDAKYLAIVLATVTFVCTIVCASLVDRSGRRPLLIISSSGCCFSMTTLALYFHVKFYRLEMASGFDWLPPIGVLLFAVFYSVGLSALPFVAAGELFSPNVKALSCSIAIVTVSLACGLVTFTFPIIVEAFGVHAAFWGYAASSLFGVFYIYLCVPETRGKTLQEIQQDIRTDQTRSH